MIFIDEKTFCRIGARNFYKFLPQKNTVNHLKKGNPISKEKSPIPVTMGKR
jgi:hypothetical protein